MSETVSLELIQRSHVEWIKSKGWYKNKTPLESIALITSEIGEAANECRAETPTDKLPSELADIILRVLALADELDIDIMDAMITKVRFNIEHKKDTPERIK